MKVAITGATGLVGSALCRLLHQDGHLPIALARDVEAASRRLPGIEVMDLNNAIAAWPECDVVVNLAAETVNGRWNSEKKLAIYDSRVIGTRKLIEAIDRAEARPRAFVSASAVGYYGDRGDEMLTERSLPGTGFLAKVGVDWEAEALRAEGLGLRVALARTAVVLGPGEGAFPRLLLPYRLGLGGPIGSGRQWFPWISLADVVGIYRMLIEDDLSGAFLATVPEPPRQAEFASAFAGALGRPAVMPLPAFVLKLMVGEFATELLDSRRCVPERTLAAGYQFALPDLRAAVKDALGEKQPA